MVNYMLNASGKRIKSFNLEIADKGSNLKLKIGLFCVWVFRSYYPPQKLLKNSPTFSIFDLTFRKSSQFIGF